MKIWDLKGDGYLYIATPYSKYKRGQYSAFVEACWITAEFLKARVGAFSPIAHSHPIASHSSLDHMDHDFWLDVVDRPMMDGARGLAVILLDGWRESYGVRKEIEVFQAAGKPIWYVDPVSLDVADFPPPAEVAA